MSILITLLMILIIHFDESSVTCKPLVQLVNISDPCSHIFHVHALNNEGGTWSIDMGNETGHVHHSVHSRVHNQNLAGEWDAQLVQRCKESWTTEQSFITETDESTEKTERVATIQHTEESQTTAEVTNTSTDRIESTDLSTIESTSFIPDDYMFYPGFGSYKFHTDIKNWDDAYEVCQSENAYLVVINSKEEAEIMQDLFEDHPEIEPQRSFIINNEAFIGVRDFSETGSFETVHGERLRNSGYEEWEPGQPDDFEDDEDCVTVLRHGTLNDRACWIELPFICEANEF